MSLIFSCCGQSGPSEDMMVAAVALSFSLRPPVYYVEGLVSTNHYFNTDLNLILWSAVVQLHRLPACTRSVVANVNTLALVSILEVRENDFSHNLNTTTHSFTEVTFCESSSGLAKKLWMHYCHLWAGVCASVLPLWLPLKIVWFALCHLLINPNESFHYFTHHLSGNDGNLVLKLRPPVLQYCTISNLSPNPELSLLRYAFLKWRTWTLTTQRRSTQSECPLKVGTKRPIPGILMTYKTPAGPPNVRAV